MVSMEVQENNRIKLEELSERMSKNKATQLVMTISLIDFQLGLVASSGDIDEYNEKRDKLRKGRERIKRRGSYVNNISSYKKDSYEWKLRMAIERCAIDDSKIDDIIIAREYIESLSNVIESYVFRYEEDTPLDDITPLVLSTLDFSDEEKEVLRIISKLGFEKKEPIEENNNARIIELRKSISRNKTIKDSYELDLRYIIKKYISNAEFTTSDIYNARGYFYSLEGDIEQVDLMTRSVINRMRTMNLKELYEYYKEYGDFINHFQYFSDIVFCSNNIRLTDEELEILRGISQHVLEVVPQK